MVQRRTAPGGRSQARELTAVDHQGWRAQIRRRWQITVLHHGTGDQCRRRLTGAINRVNAGKARLDPAAAPKQSHPPGSDAEADYEDKWSSADRKSAAQKVDAGTQQLQVSLRGSHGGTGLRRRLQGQVSSPTFGQQKWRCQGLSNPRKPKKSKL